MVSMKLTKIPLSEQIMDEFPFSNIYKKKDIKVYGKPGCIRICGNGSEKKRYVINMFS